MANLSVPSPHYSVARTASMQSISEEISRCLPVYKEQSYHGSLYFYFWARGYYWKGNVPWPQTVNPGAGQGGRLKCIRGWAMASSVVCCCCGINNLWDLIFLLSSATTNLLHHPEKSFLSVGLTSSSLGKRAYHLIHGAIHCVEWPAIR